MSIILAGGDPPVPTLTRADIENLITRLERIQSIGGGLLSHATLSLRILRAVRDGGTP